MLQARFCRSRTVSLSPSFPCSYAALPHMPDVVAIVYQILKQSQANDAVVLAERPAPKSLGGPVE